MTTTRVQTYARVAAGLGVLSFLGGGFGEAYVPSILVAPGDAASTARNIVGSEWLFRLGFAGYVVEGLCDVGLTWALYILLRPVHQNLALLAVFFRLIATAGFAMSQVLYFSALRILAGPDSPATFESGEIASLAYMSIATGKAGLEIFSLFYGVGALLLGYLVFRSGFLPKIIGILLAFGGAAFVIKGFAAVLAPAYARPVLLLPVPLGWLALTIWLLVKGVDVPKWTARAASPIPPV